MKKVPLLSLLNGKFSGNTSEENYALILCGDVLVNGNRIKNPAEKINPDDEITLAQKQYVSRGGIKLAHAIEKWKIDVRGKVFLDAGSSTGGFTDCLLQHGALCVHAVDVGYNQIDYTLRSDSRVIVHERTNIMLVESLFPEPEIGVADLSFRSIARAASRILDLVTGKKLIALIKPQFETERTNLKKGVLHERKALEETLFSVIAKLESEGSYVHDVLLSPVQGKKGNNEFLFLISRNKIKNSKTVMDKITGLISGIETFTG